MNDLDELFRQYGKTVYVFLLSLSHDEYTAEELTQETMFRAIMNIGSFRRECKITVWLCQIAKNLYFEWQRKNRRHISAEDMQEKEHDSGIRLEAELEDKDSARRILELLHTLKEPYKEVFMLHALGDVPLGRISQLFGKSDSWARVTYYRAKAMIAAELEEENL